MTTNQRETATRLSRTCPECEHPWLVEHDDIINCPLCGHEL
jgi:hypothetical protein